MQAERPPDDPGVAVYFPYGDKNMVFACGRWDRVHDNIHAIGKTIGALRGIERWCASDMLERAFTGFAAIGHESVETWRDVLNMGTRLPHETDQQQLNMAERHFKMLANSAHTDKPGGSDGAMQRLNAARDAARLALR